MGPSANAAADMARLDEQLVQVQRIRRISGRERDDACGLGNVDKAVLDYRGLRVQTHGLVAGRLVPGDAVATIGDQLLDQLGAGGLVLDQHHDRIEQPLLLAHGTLQRRILELPTEHPLLSLGWTHRT